MKLELWVIGSLFNKIRPLLMQSTLEDQENHLLMMVIDRVLYKLDNSQRSMRTAILMLRIDPSYDSPGD